MATKHPAKALFPVTKIVVPVDGSENARRALDTAISLARLQGSEIVILFAIPAIIPALSSPVSLNVPVIEYPTYYDDAQEAGSKIVGEAVQRAKDESVRARGEVLSGVASVVESICNAAEREDANLIIVGTRGLGGFSRLLLGSVSSGIVTHANCSVLVVR